MNAREAGGPDRCLGRIIKVFWGTSLQLIRQNPSRQSHQFPTWSLLIIGSGSFLRYRTGIIVNSGQKFPANDTSGLLAKFPGQLLNQRIMICLLFSRLRIRIAVNSTCCQCHTTDAAANFAKSAKSTAERGCHFRSHILFQSHFVRKSQRHGLRTIISFFKISLCLLCVVVKPFCNTYG